MYVVLEYYSILRPPSSSCSSRACDFFISVVGIHTFVAALCITTYVGDNLNNLCALAIISGGTLFVHWICIVGRWGWSKLSLNKRLTTLALFALPFGALKEEISWRRANSCMLHGSGTYSESIELDYYILPSLSIQYSLDNIPFLLVVSFLNIDCEFQCGITFWSCHGL